MSTNSGDLEVQKSVEEQRPAFLARTELRRHMPVTQQYAYFDHAAVSPLPDSSAEAIARFAWQASQQGDVPWNEWFGSVSVLKNNFAQLLNCQLEEIAIVANTSTGIGLVAEGYPWQPGDNVVVPSNEFPSNLVPWRNLARLDVEVREINVAEDGVLGLDQIDSAIDGRTRIVALSWVGFISGFRVDIEAVTELAHRRGALVMLDAIQGLGAFPIDVKKAGVDFLAADGHKWLLGPEGAGVLYISNRQLDRLQPLMVGWQSLEECFQFDPHSVKLKNSAARYEGGATNMLGALALCESTRLLLNCHAACATGPLAAAILENVQQLHDGLLKSGFTVHLPDSDHRSGIVGISWPGADLLAARKHCLAEGVILSVRGGRLRASTHAYNNLADINRLVEALKAFRKFSSRSSHE